MKKKGFTLVELLAVIVILAIIALIAIPLIGNVIEKAKIGALESSVNGLVESADMYYANETIKGSTVTETTFDWKDGVQTSDSKLEYKGKVENGKLILHANGQVAVCVDEGEHYAYKNKDTDEIVSGNGTCLYDGTTGDFSSNSSINDLRGKTLAATNITKSDDGITAIIKIPEEGHYDKTSEITVPIETIQNELNIGESAVLLFKGINSSAMPLVYSNVGSLFEINGNNYIAKKDMTVQVLESHLAHGDGTVTVTVKVNGTNVYNVTSAYGNPATASFDVNEGDVITCVSSYAGNYSGVAGLTLAI